MKSLTNIIVIILLCQIGAQGQYILNSFLKDIKNKKEVKSYEGDYFRFHEYFDKRGNLIYTKGLDHDGKILYVAYNEYTEQDEIIMRISLSTTTNLDLTYYDRSHEGEIRTYSSTRWDRNPYDYCTKSFLQKISTAEKLRGHKQIKKLLKQERKLTSKKYLNSDGQVIKRIFWDHNMNINSTEESKYDSLNNSLEQYFEYKDHNNIKQRSRKISYYDKNGNVVKFINFEIVTDNKDKELWIPKDSVIIIYNEKNQEIEYIDSRQDFSISRNKVKSNSSIKSNKNKDNDYKYLGRRRNTYDYDDKNRLISNTTFDRKGNKDDGYIYSYEGNIITKRRINYKVPKKKNESSNGGEIFEITYYE